MTWHQHLSLTDHKSGELKHFIIYRQDFTFRLPLYCVINQYGMEEAQRFTSAKAAVDFLEREHAARKD